VVSPAAFDSKLYRSRLTAGDVLINLVGASIGRTCQVPDGMPAANINQAVCVYRAHNRSLADWAAMCFAWPVIISRLLGEQVETARANLSLSDLRRFSLPLPREGERDWLVSGFRCINATVQSQVEELAQLRLLKQGLMHDLLTGRVPVTVEAEPKLREVAANV
jgi:type I restriction enzyme, S subunit